MSRNPTGEELLAELRSDPKSFDESGRATELLQRYVHGFPVKTLRPLLLSNDQHALRSAMFIASELGIGAAELLDDVVPLVAHSDRWISGYALDVITVCSVGDRADRTRHLARALEHEDPVARWAARRLLSNVSINQLEAALRAIPTSWDSASVHQRGLSLLISPGDVGSQEVLHMLHDEQQLARSYGAILARRLFGRDPHLLQEALESDDEEIREYAAEAFESPWPDYM